MCDFQHIRNGERIYVCNTDRPIPEHSNSIEQPTPAVDTTVVPLFETTSFAPSTTTAENIEVTTTSRNPTTRSLTTTPVTTSQMQVTTTQIPTTIAYHTASPTTTSYTSTTKVGIYTKKKNLQVESYTDNTVGWIIGIISALVVAFLVAFYFYKRKSKTIKEDSVLRKNLEKVQGKKMHKRPSEFKRMSIEEWRTFQDQLPKIPKRTRAPKTPVVKPQIPVVELQNGKRNLVPLSRRPPVETESINK